MAKRKKNQAPQAKAPQPWRDFHNRLNQAERSGSISAWEDMLFLAAGELAELERASGSDRGVEEILFRQSLAGYGRNPVSEVHRLLLKVEYYLAQGQTQQALLEVARSIALLSAKVSVLATILERYRPALGKEFRRIMGKEAENLSRRETADAKKRLAKEEWAQYDDADLRRPGGAATIYIKIGEDVAKRLDLPKPIKPDTIRKYLAE